IHLHDAGGSTGRITIPARLRDGGWPAYVGRVSFHRRVGKPTNLGTGDRARLAFSGVTGADQAFVQRDPDGQLVTECQVSVTDQLADRNESEVRLAAISDEAGIWGAVTIEILPGP